LARNVREEDEAAAAYAGGVDVVTPRSGGALDSTKK
jgi:hypothetical protein